MKRSLNRLKKEQRSESLRIESNMTQFCSDIKFGVCLYFRKSGVFHSFQWNFLLQKTAYSVFSHKKIRNFQDAQEFSKLLMSLLEDTLSNQTDPIVRDVIKQQFCGIYKYQTRQEYAELYFFVPGHSYSSLMPGCNAVMASDEGKMKNVK